MVYSRFQAPILITTSFFQFLLFAGLTLFLAKKWGESSLVETFRLKPAGGWILFLSPLGAVALIPFVLGLEDLLGRALPGYREFSNLGEYLYRASNPREWTLVLFTIGVTPAVCEEILFRGWFHGKLEKSWSVPGVYFLSGTVFALIHKNYFGLLVLILIGAYLGFVFQRARSLWASGLAHLAYNSTLVISYNLEGSLDFLTDSKGYTRWWAMAGSALVSLIIVALIQSAGTGRNRVEAAAPADPTAAP
jgi:hypothetical protein